MPRSVSVWASAILLLLIQTSCGFSALANPTIYRCEIAGVATFSDRPCDAESTAYEPDVTRVSTYQAPVAAKAGAQPPASARKRAARRSSTAANQAKRAAECERIQVSLREIHAKMRAGYKVREGERLKVRQAQLKERRRAQRCR